MEGDQPIRQSIFWQRAFQSTPSAWRETLDSYCCSSWYDISIHSLRMEGDKIRSSKPTTKMHFNPLPPHGGRQRGDVFFADMGNISIHSLRMEGDWGLNRNVLRLSIFQSTPSAWRETRCNDDQFRIIFHFNPLPPHGGRHKSGNVCGAWLKFQSTPSAWRETTDSANSGSICGTFQSTPSAWRETYNSVRIMQTIQFQSTPSAWRETDLRWPLTW